MPLGPIGTPAAILLLTLLVPIAFRYGWPGGIARPTPFLVVTLILALGVAAIAIFWFLQALVGVGVTGPSSRPVDRSPAFEAALRNSFITAAICAVRAQYCLCRAMQFFLKK